MNSTYYWDDPMEDEDFHTVNNYDPTRLHSGDPFNTVLAKELELQCPLALQPRTTSLDQSEDDLSSYVSTQPTAAMH